MDRFLAQDVLKGAYAGATHRVWELAIAFDRVALNRRSRPSELVEVKKLGRIQVGAGWRERDRKQHSARPSPTGPERSGGRSPRGSM